jgi:hypothetical protein
MTMRENPLPGQQPRGRYPYSTWWLLAKDENSRVEVLTLSSGEGRTLPTFSGEGEAEMFLWLGNAFEHGWHVKETSAGELVSLLSGPYAGVRSVALDPSPEMAEAETIDLVSVGRKRFLGRILTAGGKRTAPRQTCGPPSFGKPGGYHPGRLLLGAAPLQLRTERPRARRRRIYDDTGTGPDRRTRGG